jgi:hypothetical protein
MKNGLILLAFLSLVLLAADARFSKKETWNPDAGLIPSFTQDATVSASSHQNAAANILDGDPNTAWQSEAPLPEGYIKRHDLNIFLNTSHSAPSNGQAATDGILSTAVTIQTRIYIVPPKPCDLFCLSLKCQATADVTVRTLTLDGKIKEEWTYRPAENFTLKRFDAEAGVVRRVEISSAKPFELFEIAALAGPPKESVILDFGEPKPVGVIRTKHWAGDQAAVSTKIYLGNDRQQWEEVADLDPATVQLIETHLPKEISARFLKIEHTLVARDWNKVFLWEITAYDRHGHYGARPPAQPASVTFRELLGVNGYWSWGTDEYSDTHSDQQPPKLLRPVASHARNYHNITWDIRSPSERIDFGKMAAGNGTSAKEWLDWNREYKSWLDAGLSIEASIQIHEFQPADWTNPRQQAYDYAYAFTRHFGARHGNGYVCTLEAGNEPWKYDAETYRQILLGMAEGAQAGDPSVEVFPCALQAADPSTETSDVFKNYMGVRITKEAAALLDGINVHAYSYMHNAQGIRQAVHPEHASSSFWEIINAIRWRNANMPGKKIYLTEWGWDCPGGGEYCIHNECVSEKAAACYAVRGALIAARLGLERATWFYYANENRPSSLYTRSGLTGSPATGFQKKLPFLSLESFVREAGKLYFLQVVQEDETAWAYLLGDKKGKATHLVAWRPVAGDDPATTGFTWKTHRKAAKALCLDGESSPLPFEKFGTTASGRLNLTLSATPLLVYLGE